MNIVVYFWRRNKKSEKFNIHRCITICHRYVLVRICVVNETNCKVVFSFEVKNGEWSNFEWIEYQDLLQKISKAEFGGSPLVLWWMLRTHNPSHGPQIRAKTSWKNGPLDGKKNNKKIRHPNEASHAKKNIFLN